MSDPPATAWPTPRTGDDVQLELWRRAVAAVKARHEADVEEWKTQQLHRRRVWRMLQAVRAVVRSRSVRRLLGLPLTLLRIINDPLPALPRPQPPELPARPVLVTRPSPRADVRRARDALAEGRPAVALQAAEAALAVDPRDVRALDVAQHALEDQGEPTRALAFLRRQRAVQDRTWLAAAERRLLGLVVALDPRWCPLVPTFAGAADGPVLLLCATRPTADPDDDLVVVATDHEVPALDHLDAAPLDTATQDSAWWASRTARTTRPRAVAAPLDGDLRCAIAAWALARAGGVPLVLVADGPGADAHEVGGEHGRLLRTRADQLRAAASAVVEDAGGLSGAATSEVP